MLNRLIGYVRDTVEELVRIENEIKKENLSINELKNLAFDINFLNSNPSSSLGILFKTIRNNNLSDFNSALLNSLHKEIKNKNISDSFSFRNDYKDGMYSLINHMRFNLMEVQEMFYNSDKFEFNCDEINNTNSPETLLDIIKDHILQSKQTIQDEIINSLIYSVYIPEPDNSWKPKEFQLEYYKKWIDNSITFSDLSQNSFYFINDYLKNEIIEFDIKEQIDKKKEELFREGIERKLKSLIRDLSEIDKFKRKHTIEIHQNLINQLLKGDTSDLLIDRLNVFIKISNPKEVILKYDELLHSDYYNYFELNVYEPHKIRKFSSVFTAHLIYEYLKVLNNPKSIPDQEEEDSEQISTKSKRLSFKFNGDSEKLTLTFKSLQFKIDLLKDDTQIEYLIDVMTSDDLSEFSDNIIIGCDTKQFAYVLTSLKPYFNNLTMVSIEDCKLFKSKNGNYIKANGLYSKNQMKPKKSEDIDKAINKMK